MKRFFIDSSVFFAACYSTQGKSRDLFVKAVKGEVILVVSAFVLDETRAVLADKAPQAIPALDTLLTVVPFEMVEPDLRQVLRASRIQTLDDVMDAPILAAARKARVDLLVTFDRKHLLNRPILADYIKCPIVVPDEAVGMIRET